MQPFILYRDDKTLSFSIEGGDSVPAKSSIVRFCSKDDQLFLVDIEQNLFYGVADDISVNLKLLKEGIIDIDLYQNTLYFVDKNGRIFEQNIENLEEDCLEIHVLDIAAENRRIPISQVKCNAIGKIMITAEKELYGQGNFASILTSEVPIKFECFSGLKVCDVSAGEDFFIILTYKEAKRRFDVEEDDASSSSINDIDKSNKDVFVDNQDENLFSLKRKDTQKMFFEEDEEHKDEPDYDGSSQRSVSSTAHNVYRFNNEMRSNVRYLIQKGCNIVTTNIWSFGHQNNGTLGTGDHIKRKGLNTVLNLNGIGVCSISSGREHTLARTIDGRLYQWGSNERNQIDEFLKMDTVSAPRLDRSISKKNASVIEAFCSDFKTILLKSDLTLIEFCREALKRELLLKDNNTSDKGFPIFLSTRRFLIQNYKIFVNEIQSALETSQLSVRACITSLTHIKFLQKNITKKLKYLSEFDKLCQWYMNVVYVLALNLQSLERFYRNDVKFHDISVLKNFNEFTDIIGNYVNVFCNIKSINGFSEIAKGCENLKTTFDVSKLESMFSQPFDELRNIINLFEQLAEIYPDSSDFLQKYFQEWKSFAWFYQKEYDLATTTAFFWTERDRYSELRNLKKPARRVVLDSWRCPLKQLNSRKFSSYFFILFNDSLVYFGSQLEIHPLTTVWAQNDGDLTFRIITPEKSYNLNAKNAGDKRKWLSEIERCVNTALGRHPEDKMTKARTAAYAYSVNHSLHPNVRCVGRWELGSMNGIAHLEFPDGRIYYGELINGKIEGQGQMLTPALGMYEGQFKNGKYNGYGVYEMKNNEVYEGYFRNGVFHGHGVLRNNFTTYVGEFCNNVKTGYGVLDDTITGDKYLGMFADNERAGPGVCITMNGDYFEGLFANNKLDGQGLAVLEGGCYYEGELGMLGPHGKGVYYLPQKEDANIEDRKLLKGNVVTGVLDGSWTDVKVVNGSVTLNRQFPRLPESIGSLIVDNRHKWCSLFDNWEEQIFGKYSMLDTKQIWDKIAIFIDRRKKQEKKKSTGESTTSKNFFVQNLLLHSVSGGLDPKMENSASLDKLSLRSTHSRYSRRSTLELHSNKKAYSNETLFENKSFFERNEIQLEQKLCNSFTSLRAFDDTASLIDKQRNYDDYLISDNNNDRTLHSLEFTPGFGMSKLTVEDLKDIRDYLQQAFKDQHHPLYLLNQKITNSFYSSYGCWKSKPPQILSKQAILEWDSITSRLFEIVQRLFPALQLENCEGIHVTNSSLLYPIVSAEGVYSTLFVLYANKTSEKDEIYRQKVLLSAKLTTENLSNILGIDNEISPLLNDELFNEAIKTLKQITEKFSRDEMLSVIEKSYHLIDEARIKSLEKSVILTTDSIMPISIFLVLKSGVPHLGAELALLEDLFGKDFESETTGFAGYCLTNVQASYKYIVSSLSFKD